MENTSPTVAHAAKVDFPLIHSERGRIRWFGFFRVKFHFAIAGTLDQDRFACSSPHDCAVIHWERLKAVALSERQNHNCMITIKDRQSPSLSSSRHSAPQAQRNRSFLLVVLDEVLRK
nr:hypothetical protein Iba_chr15bCG11340 [Ipomoea batatas]